MIIRKQRWEVLMKNTIIDQDGLLIASIHQPTTQESDIQKRDINAQLIATAPKLLDFLSECLSCTTDKELYDFVFNHGVDLELEATQTEGDS